MDRTAGHRRRLRARAAHPRRPRGRRPRRRTARAGPRDRRTGPHPPCGGTSPTHRTARRWWS
ncbi:hypothetical protein LT493_05015 [Streptomyces tricolor]|nr:hypothetical protein [Streptomyces tricolor]